MTKYCQARPNLTSIFPNLSCLNGERSMEERRSISKLQTTIKTQHRTEAVAIMSTAHLDLLKDVDINI